MATSQDLRKLCRIVAYDVRFVGRVPTVNIITSAPADKHQSKEHVQLTAAQTVVGVHDTYMASGGSIKGLPNIYISGYTAPN